VLCWKPECVGWGLPEPAFNKLFTNLISEKDPIEQVGLIEAILANSVANDVRNQQQLAVITNLAPALRLPVCMAIRQRLSSLPESHCDWVRPDDALCASHVCRKTGAELGLKPVCKPGLPSLIATQD